MLQLLENQEIGTRLLIKITVDIFTKNYYQIRKQKKQIEVALIEKALQLFQV